MSPSNCPRFDDCSAPICPLDPEWRYRKLVGAEAVCFWLREAVKAGGEAEIRAALPDDMARLVLDAVQPMSAAHADIAYTLRRAARSGSKRRSGRTLLADSQMAQRVGTDG